LSPDGFADGHWLARIVGWLIPIAILLIIWVGLAGRGKLVGTREVEGTFLERHGRVCLVETTEGDRVRLPCTRAFEQGEKLRLKRLDYASGKRRYALLDSPSRD
jgi:hypothetical protein